VIEQEIDNNGQMIAGTYHKEKLPLVNYIMPTAYQWTRVFLQADMRVEEFNAANGFNIQAKSSSFSASARASYGLGGFGASGGVSYGQSNVSAAGETSFARDQAAGTLHMEATLEPRADVRLPQPFILQKGPRIKVTAGARQDILGTATPPAPAPVIGRKLTLTIELRDKANNPLAGKQLEYRISQPLLNYTPTPASGQTDSNGQLLVELRREGAAFDATRPPEAVTVNVWLGLINEQVVVNI